MDQLIQNAAFVKSSSVATECPAPDLPEYAFIGRSNVGKSSLINMLTGRNKLAKVSGRPGKTQLINHFLIDESWYLVDLPGYGWAKVSKTEKAKWKIMIDEYLLTRPNLICVCLLVDSRHEPQPIDLEFMQWLGEEGIPFVIIYTKTDKLTKVKLDSSIARYRRILKQSWEELPPQFLTSSETDMGREELIKYIQEINRSVDKKL
ncbi:MAG: ribosome biogenesis GTP-binding protein YihA/YsxC [Cyclobacteriaceae bacterium]